MSPTTPALPAASPAGRTLAPGQVCRVVVAGLDGGRRVVHEDDAVLLEAPNWAGDDVLVLNGDGVLWDLPADGTGTPTPIPTTGLPEVNNDHVLSPDGRLLYASANDWHVYAVPRHGGAARRVTADDGRMHFLHGVSPDGSTLAYVALEPADGDRWARADLRLIAVDGSEDRALTSSDRPDDGPEFSPDGQWVYFGTESFTTAPGHAQIARVRPDGTGLERLTTGEGVHWFPHLNAPGTHAVYLSYPPGTVGHPADLPVEICLVALDDWQHPVARIALFGGQGTINVSSWSPDGQRFAYVEYPVSPRG